MNFYSLNQDQIIFFVLILIRVSSFLLASSVFGSPLIAPQMKILLSLILAFILYPIVVNDTPVVINNYEFISIIIKEIFVGVSLGYLTRLFFFIVSAAADIISISLGLNTSQLYNPLMGSPSNSIDQMYLIIATLVFFVVNGHHMLIEALFESFKWIKVNDASLATVVFQDIVIFGQQCLLLALKLCSPILVSIFITNVAMAIIGRAVPQLNVLVTSVPITVFIGMAVWFLTLPMMIQQMHGMMDISLTQVMKFMKGL